MVWHHRTMDRTPTAIFLFMSMAVLAGKSLSAPAISKAAVGNLDATVAAPASHHVIFENDRVRVLKVTIPPGQTEPVHTHAWPSVMRVEHPQAITYITYAVRGGKLVETARHEVPLRTPAEAEWMGPEGPHAVQNRGAGEYEAIRIELKPAH